MPNVFLQLPVPAPGTEFGAPIPVGSLFGGMASKKSVSIAGPSLQPGNKIIIEGSNVLAPNPATDFAPLVQFEGSSDNVAREINGVILWMRVRRVAGAGPAGVLVGVAGDGSCECPPAFAGNPVLNLAMRSEDEGSVAAGAGFQVIAESLMNLSSGFPPGFLANLKGSVSFLGRADAGGASVDVQLQIGGTPGVADGTPIASLAALAYPNTAAPGGQGYDSGPGAPFANPGGTVLVKVAVRGNGAGYTAYTRAISAQIFV